MGQRGTTVGEGGIQKLNSEENEGNSFLTGQNKLNSENGGYFIKACRGKLGKSYLILRRNSFLKFFRRK